MKRTWMILLLVLSMNVIAAGRQQLPNEQKRDPFTTSDKMYAEAGMTYIGREITADDILEKLPPADRTDDARAILDVFLGGLADFKIGNVIGIDYESNEGFSLNRLRPSARVADRKKLP